MQVRWIWLLFAAAACAPLERPVRPVVEVEVGEPDPAWRDIASMADRQRIEDVARAWTEATAQVGSRRYGRAVRDEGPLLEADAALLRPSPPPGPYVCRTLKLGARRARSPAYAAYRPFFCYIDAEDDALTFVKIAGTQRPAGRFYADSDDKRLIFLGTLALGAERKQLRYGEDPQRDMAGVVERVAPFRYRLVIPFPRYESTLDVIELVPFVPDNAMRP